jgi:hypothetical protein
MAILTATYRQPQLRCLALSGGDEPLPFQYKRRIAARWVSCTHSRALAIVAVAKRRWERGGAK